MQFQIEAIQKMFGRSVNIPILETCALDQLQESSDTSVRLQMSFAQPLNPVDLKLHSLVGLRLEAVPAEGRPAQSGRRLDLTERLPRLGQNLLGRNRHVAHWKGKIGQGILRDVQKLRLYKGGGVN